MTLRIVHVVARPFLPPVSGGRLKAACLASALARRGEVHWICLDDDRRERGVSEPPRALELPWGGSGTWHGAMEVSCKRGLLPRSPAGWLRAARAGVRLPMDWLPFTERHGEAMALIARLRPDLVVADETLLAPFAAFAPARWRVVHTHNLDSDLLADRIFQGADGGHHRRSARRLERIERTLLPRVDQVWGVRDADLEAFRARGVASGKLFLAPNVVPSEAFLADPRPGLPDRALFFGSLWYEPNRAALAWLLEAWPEVLLARPGARLAVAGAGAPPDLEARAAATPGVDLLGFVPDLAALLRASGLVVIPLLHGGGTKIKTIEAMAGGRPILASPVAAEGLGLEDGVHAVIREPGQDFLEAMAAMLGAPEAWQDLGRRGQDHARAHFSLTALEGCVDRALGLLG